MNTVPKIISAFKSLGIDELEEVLHGIFDTISRQYGYGRAVQVRSRPVTAFPIPRSFMLVFPSMMSSAIPAVWRVLLPASNRTSSSMCTQVLGKALAGPVIDRTDGERTSAWHVLYVWVSRAICTTALSRLSARPRSHDVDHVGHRLYLCDIATHSAGNVFPPTSNASPR